MSRAPAVSGTLLKADSWLAGAVTLLLLLLLYMLLRGLFLFATLLLIVSRCISPPLVHGLVIQPAFLPQLFASFTIGMGCPALPEEDVGGALWYTMLTV